MKAYTVQPVFDSDHAMQIMADSDLDAAAKYLTNRPVAKDIIVSGGGAGERVVKLADILTAYPDLDALIKSAKTKAAPAADADEVWAKADDAKYAKIGGWLWGVAFSLVVSIIVNISAAMDSWAMLHDENMENAESMYPGLTNLCIFEFAVNIAFVLACIVVTYMFFRRKRITRVLVILLYVAAIATIVVDTVWANNLVGDSAALDMSEAVKSMILQVVVICYFAVSKRVKKTFVVD
ncbi:MAG: DUF2569 domain-containing protein [Opitutales bacterium]|jgi:hypothetical protein